MILFSHSKNVMADSKEMSLFAVVSKGPEDSMHLNKGAKEHIKRLFGRCTYLFSLAGSAPRNRLKSYIGAGSSSLKDFDLNFVDLDSVHHV